VLEGLSQIIERSQTLLKQFSQWQTKVLDKIAQSDVKTIEPAVYSKLIVAQHFLDELAGTVHVTILSVAKNRQRIDDGFPTR
jgi:hypothetical protein